MVSSPFRSTPVLTTTSPRSIESCRRQAASLDPSLLSVEQQVIAIVSPHHSIDQINSILAGDLTVVAPKEKAEYRVPCVDRAVETDPLLSYPDERQYKTSEPSHAPSLCNSTASESRHSDIGREEGQIKDIEPSSDCDVCRSNPKLRDNVATDFEEIEMIIEGSDDAPPPTVQPTCGFCACFMKNNNAKVKQVDRVSRASEATGNHAI